MNIKQQLENKLVVQTTSIIPSIQEIERFYNFLNTKHKLGLPNNILFTIEQKSPKMLGYFMPSNNPTCYQKENTTLNTITLNSLFLIKGHPYITIAHEIAHFYNSFLGIKDCSSNQYHNKHFKKSAEMLGLLVTKTNKGFSQTDETTEFEDTLKEFMPTKDAFIIFQNNKEKVKKPSRNILFTCMCGVKIRTARNNFLGAICRGCNTEFIEKDNGENDEDD
jgi:hypothetical protein